jgi:hypothetical protein
MGAKVVSEGKEGGRGKGPGQKGCRKCLLRLAFFVFGHDGTGVVVQWAIKVRCHLRMSMCGGDGDNKLVKAIPNQSESPPLA